jgi:hypothetical protein
MILRGHIDRERCESSINGVIAALDAAIKALRQAVTYAREAKAQALQMRDLGRSTGVRSVVERAERIRDRVEKVEAMISTGITMVEEAIARAEEAEGAPAGMSAAPGSSPPIVPSPTIVETGRSLPVREGRIDPTTGVFNGERISSNEDQATVADLQPLPGGGWPRAIISHVESHAAARMRRQGLREGTVVLNNLTCGNRGFDEDWPMTCERYLPSLLPAGARLTVWATTDGGAT